MFARQIENKSRTTESQKLDYFSLFLEKKKHPKTKTLRFNCPLRTPWKS